MNITFSIKYKALWGQKLYISGSISELGSWDETQAIELSPQQEDCWGGTIPIDGRKKEFTYCYLVKDDRGKVVRREWKRMHRLSIKHNFRSLLMTDRWIDRPSNAPFYSSAFYGVLYRHEVRGHKPQVRQEDEQIIVLQVYAPTVPSAHHLKVTGSTQKLGHWDATKAAEFSYMGKGEWITFFAINRAEQAARDMYFKFFITDESGAICRWEDGDDHHYQLPEFGQYDGIYIAGLLFNEGDHKPRVAGTVIPVFSLRHEEDYGIGDFGSLRRAVDWASEVGFHILQILPINDTTYYRDWRDSYPYNAISVDALHPIYIDLKAMPRLRDTRAEKAFELRAAELRRSPTHLYPEVMKLKEEYLRLHYREYGRKVLESTSYKTFLRKHHTWLTPYAIFCVLRDKHPHQHFDQWGAYARYDQVQTPQHFVRDFGHEEADYYRYIQYWLSTQLAEVSVYAEGRGVLLKGDIPIGVAPHSISVWSEPHLFYRHLSAGAPPDAFATDGQNWGFPTYNWTNMLQRDLNWWRSRFECMSTYFKAFRIDHILGFFRIWEIPSDQRSGLLGHFSPSRPLTLKFWRDHFDRFCSIEELIQPCFSQERLEEVLGHHLDGLKQSGWVVPIQGSKYYTLRYVRQQSYASMPSDEIPGGSEARRLLQELCREVALVQDTHRPYYYHPRIAFTESKQFKLWNPAMQEIWRQICHHYFYEVHNSLWRDTALERLIPLIECTDMLVCAEDLGMIPACVPQVLEDIQILSLELERMPKGETEHGWADLGRLPYRSVCTTSTHDMPTLRGWWHHLDPEQQALYLETQLLHSGLRVDKSSEAEIMEAIIRNHLASASMLAILPLSDWMAISEELHLLRPEEEQINHPEDPHQRWEYRMPLTIEQLRSNYPLWKKQIRSLLEQTHRDRTTLS